MTPEEMLNKLDALYELELVKRSLGVEQIARFDECNETENAIIGQFSELGFTVIIDNGLPMLMAKRHE